MSFCVGMRIAHLRSRVILFPLIALCCLAMMMSLYAPSSSFRPIRERSASQTEGGHRVACAPSSGDDETMLELSEQKDYQQTVDSDITLQQVNQKKHIVTPKYDDRAIAVSSLDVSPTAKRRRSGSSQ